MYTILQISDLHRSSEEPVDNSTLVAALLADADRYLIETPSIEMPDAIVVSGDLIQGVPINQSNWRKSMASQYEMAEDFLNQLVCRFLEGDRSKIAIVPGNHDVCWNTSFSAMEKIEPTEYPHDVRRALLEPDSPYRWSWKEQVLYRICDTDKYEQRLEFYWNFVEKFYSGVRLPMQIDRRRGYQLFEFYNRRVLVAGFDTTYGNDCFGYTGAIKRGAVAKCNLDLRDIQHTYDLNMAVWHHSIQGPPVKDDYMDIAQVHEMIGLGFRIGLHGHQHVAETVTGQIHFSQTETMSIVSAGSLCAGSKELPRGVNRQYNLIVLNDDFLSARVHVREMTEGEQYSRKTNGSFNDGYSDLQWTALTDTAGRKVKVQGENIRRTVLEAERVLRSGDPKKSIILLHSVELSEGSYARKIALEAFVETKNWSLLIETIKEPNTSEEAVFLISALIESGLEEQASNMLANLTSLDAGTRSGLQDKIEIKRLMRV